jgi:segregation and condensation protein A
LFEIALLQLQNVCNAVSVKLTFTAHITAGNEVMTALLQPQPGPAERDPRAFLTADNTYEGRIFVGHTVKLPVFEGPLDLLLYLIRKNEVDIYDIPIALITEQYLEHLTMLEGLDFETAGDFVVMAATLMEIKSRYLLPRPEPIDEEEEAAGDPRAELVARLLDYKRYKDAAGDLEQRAQEQRFVVPRPAAVSNGYGNGNTGFVLANDVSAVHLWAAFQQVLTRARENPVGEIVRPRFTVAMKITEISARLRRNPDGLSFFSLFPESTTKLEVIITFLALLELIRMGQIRISQPKAFADIQLFAKQPEQVPVVGTA